jgi:hypothetical protein
LSRPDGDLVITIKKDPHRPREWAREMAFVDSAGQH